MNKLSILSLSLICALAGACKKKEDKPAGDNAATGAATNAATAARPTDQAPPAPAPAPPTPAVAMAPLDLTAVGEDWAGWTVSAPQGATVKESFGAAQITSGSNFNLDIRPDKGDVAAFKKEVEGNDMNKVKRFVVDTPEVILYESEVMGQNEFHLYGNVTVGDKTFNCEDVKGPRHMQADAEAMWKTCQSLAKK